MLAPRTEVSAATGRPAHGRSRVGPNADEASTLRAGTEPRRVALIGSLAYSHRVLDGIGHNVLQEAPEAFADAILEVGATR
jgi:hypothetical protein